MGGGCLMADMARNEKVADGILLKGRVIVYTGGEEFDSLPIVDHVVSENGQGEHSEERQGRV